MRWTRLYVDKADGTFADALVTFGLAEVARHVFEHLGFSPDGIRIRDEGVCYTLALSPALDESDLGRCPFFMPVSFLRTAKNVEQLPSGLSGKVVIDYEKERDRRTGYLQLRERYSQEAKKAQQRLEEHPLFAALQAQTPHRDWDTLRAINPEALAGYNNLLLKWWQAGQSGSFPQLLSLLLQTFATTPNDVEHAQELWRALAKNAGLDESGDATSLQLYNPSKGKGQNRPKSDALKMDNLKDFWLAEFLKAVGFYQGALTKVLSGRGQPARSNDRKTYVVSPNDMRYSDLGRVISSFKDKMVRSETARRLDVLAALRFTVALLERATEPDGADVLQTLLGNTPRRAVSGFQSASYKDLGQGKATINISFINLPGWARLTGRESARDYLAALSEHEGIIRQFQEDRGEDVELLGLYRDFMSGNDLWPFLAFTAGYSGWLISQREHRNRGRQFTTDNLGRLFMNVEPALKDIIESEGFRNLAYAIRQATVIAQYRKKQGDRRYDVFYGLGQRLVRQTYKREAFVAELMDFVRAYNTENAQVMENRQGPYRRSVRTTDLDEVVELIDRFGSQLVGNMLVAYGYAREPFEQEPQADQEAEENTDDTSEQN